MSQPKCHLTVCRTMCPYRDMKWMADIIHMDNGNDAVALLKDRGDGYFSACAVIYLNGKCDESEVHGREVQFAGRHSPRLLDVCPMMMEHEMYGWNRGRRSKGNR